MSRLPLAAAASVALAGCFSPVHPGTRSGADASVAVAPDAGAACTRDSDCPAPVSTDPVCAPLVASCEHGACGSKLAARPWDGHPGACQSAAQCECQGLDTPNCIGGWACLAGACSYQCSNCTSDLQCRSGQVCAEDCQGVKACRTGCRTGLECASGEICRVATPECGEAFGQCEAAPECSSDADCPAGSVCDWAEIGSSRQTCVTGCHVDTQCAAAQTCLLTACYNCPDCPCYGRCEPQEGCASDADCAAGTVCASEPERCDLHCVAGCHEEADCRADQACARPDCLACGCDHGVCARKTATCSSDSDCASGEVCAPLDDPFGCTGVKTCVAGCFDDGDCGGEEMVCLRASCGACCPGTCMAVPLGCQSDRECQAGQVCEGCDETAKFCTAGCRDGSGCASGQVCLDVDCGFCPCPAQCFAAPVACSADWECGRGMVCEGETCLTGCRDASGCKEGQICEQVVCGTWPCPAQCTDAPSACSSDTECGVGMVCEPGPGCVGSNGCVVGCHDTSQCAEGEICITEVDCLTCPCPGFCQAQGCVWGQEACASGLDCAWGSEACGSSGCCESCVEPPSPICGADQCWWPGGVDLNGCSAGLVCGSCCQCELGLPVCGANYQTYAGDCEAGCAGVEVLHQGACLAYEGLACGYNGVECPAGEYCRDPCPRCGSIQQLRCTQMGACLEDWDCPAGLGATACADGSAPAWSCLNHGCVASCP